MSSPTTSPQQTDNQPASQQTGQQSSPQPGQQGQSTAMQPRRGQQLRSWDPFDMFEDMQHEMARIWNQFWPSTWMPPTMVRGGRSTSMQWAPRVDIFEQNNEIVVKAELPGVKKEDIQVEMDRDSLVISGQRHAESNVREENFYRSERSYGSFYRRLPLPEGVKPDQIKASFNDGILEVRIPRPSQQQPEQRRIEVK